MDADQRAQFRRAIDEVSAQSGISLEEAAQRFAQALFHHLRESLVLVRTYVTLDYRDLPEATRAAADEMATKAQLSLGPTSAVLALLGTAGARPEWNDRACSKAHAGIPLVSAKFVSAIPMVSALLEQLGVDLGWIHGGGQIDTEALGRLAGGFYVDDATKAKDLLGRHIIPAQDFVATHHVQTVFGIGGGYPGTSAFNVTIFFMNEAISRDTARSFQGLLLAFKNGTKKFMAPTRARVIRAA